jgi:hypothetical protein
MLPDEVPKSFQGVAIERGGLAAAVGPWFDRTGLPAELEQSRDTRDIDGEPLRDLAERALVVVNGGEDALAEVVR